MSRDAPSSSFFKDASITSHLHCDSSLPTTIKLRVIGRQQQLIRVDFESQPSHEVLRDKFEQFETLLKDYDIVIMSDYGKGGLTHIKRMIEAARAAGLVVLIDPKGDDYRALCTRQPADAQSQRIARRGRALVE